MEEESSVAWSEDSLSESRPRQTGAPPQPPVSGANPTPAQPPAEEETSVAWSEDSVSESEAHQPPSSPPAPSPQSGGSLPTPPGEERTRAFAAPPAQVEWEEEPEESVAWSEEDESQRTELPASAPPAAPAAMRTAAPAEDPTPPREIPTTIPTSMPTEPAPMPAADAPEPAVQPQQVPSSSSSPPPSPPPATNKTTYANVYCGDLEGRLDVSDEGILFVPYIPSKLPAYNPTPHDIAWKDTTYREFYKEDVKAGYSGYSTIIAMYNLKIGVLPSREAIFSLRRGDEYDRLQCDLDARGYGAPPPPPPAHAPAPADDTPTGGTNPTTAGVAPGFHPDDYDHAEAVYDDGMEEVHWDDEREHDERAAEEEVHWSDEEDDDVDEAGMRQTPTTDRTQGGDDDEINLGWSTQDTTAMPNSSYYPVTCKRELGSLVLTGNQLQFIPDRHSAPIKSIPWAAFAGKPFYSPWNYPRAQMAIHYYTRGPNKKVGFDLPSHEELLRLEDDIRDRMRPYKNAPREQVRVPPKMPRDIPSYTQGPPSVSKPRGGGGSVSGGEPYKKSQKKMAPSDGSVTVTEETTSFGGYEGPVTAASAVPLMANTARRVPYHKDEPNRRLMLLFVSYCCIVTLTGLTFSILFGYFFGPRRPKEQYIRTESPYEIGSNYLGTKPPSMAPTPKDRNEWKSDSVTMNRGFTEPPEGTVEQPPAPEEEKKEKEQEQAQEQPPQVEETTGNDFGLGIGSGIGRPVPGANINLPGSGMGSGGSIRGSDFEVATVAPIETSNPTTLAPTVMEETVPPTAAAIPSTEEPSAEPTAGAPTTAPITATPTIAPTTPAPTIVETRSSKSIVQLLMEKSPDKGQSLRTPGTPQQAAYLLMKVSGLLENAPSDEMIVQKFALSTLYYAAGGNDWNEGSMDWKDLADSDCNKAHVLCDAATQETIGIDMPHNNMQGSIPAEIGLLDKLNYISFQDNDLVGAIPTEMGLLKNLQTLDLAGNPKLEAVPEEVRVLPRLATIKVDNP